MATAAGWAAMAFMVGAVIVVAYGVIVACGIVGQRAATYSGRGWVGAVIGLAIFAALVGAEAWLLRDHIQCSPAGCHEDSASPPEYP